MPPYKVKPPKKPCPPPKKPCPPPPKPPLRARTRCLGPGREHSFLAEVGGHNRMCADCRAKVLAMHLSATMLFPVRDPSDA